MRDVRSRIGEFTGCVTCAEVDSRGLVDVASGTGAFGCGAVCYVYGGLMPGASFAPRAQVPGFLRTSPHSRPIAIPHVRASRAAPRAPPLASLRPRLTSGARQRGPWQWGT